MRFKHHIRPPVAARSNVPAYDHPHLSKTSIVVSGKFRLMRDLILTTLPSTRRSSGVLARPYSRASNGRTNTMVKAAKKAAKKPAAKKTATKTAAKKVAKKPAAKKKAAKK